tara:strand:+ start:52 stop:480 length:429 start_codon:yes stop_codon:yes gene_type:complete
MIQASNIIKISSSKVKEMNCFLVDVKISNTNDIKITFDKTEGVSLDDCISLTKFVEGKLDREIEDFSLSVSSPGIYSPFIVHDQFYKNYNNVVDILMKSGEKFKGILDKFNAETEIITIKSSKGKKNNYQLSQIKKINKSKI